MCPGATGRRPGRTGDMLPGVGRPLEKACPLGTGASPSRYHALMPVDSPGFRPGGRQWLQRLAPLIALTALVGVTILYEQLVRAPDERTFLKPENLLNILRQAAPVGVVAIGMTFVIAAGGIDLSVGSIVALAGGVGILAMDAVARDGWPPAVAIALGLGTTLGAGLACGAVNGVLAGLMRLPPFIATLGTLAAFRSLAVALADGGSFSPGYDVRGQLQAVGDMGRAGIPLGTWDSTPIQLHYPILILVTLAILGAAIVRQTVFGVHVRAAGDNEQAAAYAAIPVARVRCLTYMLAGLAAGIAGVLLTLRMGGSLPSGDTGLFYELDAIAAVVIGGTSMQGGSARVLGTLAGVLILAVISNMLSMMGIGGHFQGLFKGCVIIAAVILQRVIGPRM